MVLKRSVGLASLIAISGLAGCSDHPVYKEATVIKEQRNDSNSSYAIQVTDHDRNFTIGIYGDDTTLNALDLTISSGTRISFEYEKRGVPTLRGDGIGTLAWYKIKVLPDSSTSVEKN